MAHVVVHKSQQMVEDRVIQDKDKVAEDLLKKRKEEEKKKQEMIMRE